MANINAVVDRPIADGYKLKFRTPCDSTTIEGLEVKYPAKNGVGTLIKKFIFKDAHGTELSGVGNLFVSGVMIEVLLDVTHSVAYIQNADTNSYVESVKGEVRRLEEAQRQFLSVAGRAVEECENATAHAYAAADTWVGTQAEYDELTEKVENCLYLIEDDTTLERFETNIKKNTLSIEGLKNDSSINKAKIGVLESDVDGNKTAIEKNKAAIEENKTAIEGLQNTVDSYANSGQLEFTDELGDDGLIVARIPIPSKPRGTLLVSVCSPAFPTAPSDNRYSLRVIYYDKEIRDDGAILFDVVKISGDADLCCSVTADGSTILVATNTQHSYGWWIGNV